MGNVSKEQFNRAQHLLSCQMFHHVSPNCIKSIPVMSYHCFLGGSKFFIPIYLLRLMYKQKTPWKNHLKEYMRSVLYCSTFAMMYLYGNCIFSRLFGKYYYCMATSAFFSGTAIFIESEANRVLDTLIFFNQFLETVVVYLDKNNIFKRTRARETFTFMLISSALMYFLKRKGSSTDFFNLWFYHPNKKYVATESHKVQLCTHKDGCPSFIFKGAYRYFFLGCLVQAARNAVSQLGNIFKDPLVVPKSIFSMKTLTFGAFIGGYVGVYRAVMCYLIKLNKKDSDAHSIIAGFLAGSTYYLKPTLQLYTIAFSTLLQVLFYKKYQEVKKKTKLPLMEIFFCFLTSFLIHHYANYITSCPKYVQNMTYMVTNGQIERSRKEYIKLAYSLS